MSISGIHNSEVLFLILWGGRKCPTINNLHNFSRRFWLQGRGFAVPGQYELFGIAAFSPSEFSSNFNKPIIFSKKMKEIKKFNEQERQSYVPASVKVIEVTAQKVMCTSPSPNEFSPYQDGWNI